MCIDNDLESLLFIFFSSKGDRFKAEKEFGNSFIDIDDLVVEKRGNIVTLGSKDILERLADYVLHDVVEGIDNPEDVFDVSDSFDSAFVLVPIMDTFNKEIRFNLLGDRRYIKSVTKLIKELSLEGFYAGDYVIIPGINKVIGFSSSDYSQIDKAGDIMLAIEKTSPDYEEWLDYDPLEED